MHLDADELVVAIALTNTFYYLFNWWCWGLLRTIFPNFSGKNRKLQRHFLIVIINFYSNYTQQFTCEEWNYTPAILNENLHLILKLFLGSTKARKRYLYFFDFSSSVNLRFHFSLFLAHRKIAFTSSSSADESNARLACGLVSLRTWRKCSFA